MRQEALVAGVVCTDDGSLTLFDDVHRQTYHSVRGARAEAEHVFLRLSGIEERLVLGQETSVLEVGWGTGLNWAVAAASALGAGSSLTWYSTEPNPLDPAILRVLGTDQGLPEAVAAAFHQACAALLAAPAGTWVEGVALCGPSRLALRIFRGPVQDLGDEPTGVDALVHDAFSPDTCADLWSTELFASLGRRVRPGGVLVTYSVAGSVRRALRAAGWSVSKHAGPPQGKREVLRALWPASPGGER